MAKQMPQSAPKSKGSAKGGKGQRRVATSPSSTSPPSKPTHRWVLVLDTKMKKRMRYLPIEG